MAKEPDSLVLRLLRDIRATQQTHGKKLDHLDKRVEDLYKISTHTLGVAANAHVRYEALEARVERLGERVKRLEAKQ
jgi:polyhydroxyalkanoate synthesis regulator phasin